MIDLLAWWISAILLQQSLTTPVSAARPSRLPAPPVAAIQQPAAVQQLPAVQQPQALPSPVSGSQGIPPRDPRLPAPETAETAVPPPVTVPPTQTAGVPVRPLTAREAALIALRLQPNLEIARAGISSQRALTRQIRSALLPQLTVLGSYNYVSTLHLQPGASGAGLSGSASNTSVGGVSPGTGTTSETGTGSTGTGSTGTGTGSTGNSGSTGSGSTASGSSGTGSTGSGSTGTGTGSTGTTGTGSAGTSTGTGSTGTGTGTTGTGTTGTGSTGTGTGTTGTGTTGTGTTGTGTTGTTGTSSQTGSGSTVSTGSSSSGNVNPGTGLSSVANSVTTLGGLLVEGLVAEAGLHQLIYDFNHTRDLIRQSTLLERAAMQNLTRVQSDTVYQVKQAFYQYVQDVRLVTVDEQNLANRQSQLDLALSRYNVGLGLQSDVVSAQTAKAEAVQILNSARANRELSRANLAALMGIDPRTPINAALTGEPAPPLDNVNLLVQQALLRRPEMLQAQSTLQSTQYGVSAARSGNAPVISGDVNAISVGNQFVPQNDYLTVGISVQFTPFDGGLTAGRVDQARANVTIARAQLVATQITVKNDVTQAYVNLHTAEQNIVAATADVANAEVGVRIATGRYSTGLGLFLDILNAQAFLLTAQTSLTVAQSDLDQARAALSHAIGAPITP